MSPESFKYLLNVVGILITKKDTRFRKAISPAELLYLMLHYLTYGCRQKSLSFSFQIPKSIISNIINKTCSTVWGKWIFQILITSKIHMRLVKFIFIWLVTKHSKYRSGLWNLTLVKESKETRLFLTIGCQGHTR